MEYTIFCLLIYPFILTFMVRIPQFKNPDCKHFNSLEFPNPLIY